MASTSKAMSEFRLATKKFPAKQMGAPWNLIGATTIPYEDAYKHPFRKGSGGTLPSTVKLYSAIARAAEMFRAETALPLTTAPDYQMICKSYQAKDSNGKTVKKREVMVELLYKSGTGLLVHKKGADIRVSNMEDDGTNSPCPEFKAMDEYALAAIWLACMPEMLDADNEQGGNLVAKMDDFGGHISEFQSWASAADVPEMAKVAAFYIADAMFCYASDHAEWSFSNDATATVAEQVNEDFTNGTKPFSGALMACSNPNVAFKYALSNGSMDAGVGKGMTIGELKQELVGFMSHRHWSKAEQMMIPYFRDDEPVMEETIRIARRIFGTWKAVNPVKNLMWRGITSYGKSTGVRQLAHCLNMPLLIMTCHPGMDVMEWKSNLVPETEDDGLEVDATAITLKEQETKMAPDLQLAVDHISALEAEERKAFLDGSDFYMEAMMDSEGAAYSLFGKDVEMDSAQLCKVYADAVSFFREKPLRIKIMQLETDEPEKEVKKEERKPGFKHVLSAYMKALINGYMVEIQEASRIRDSGVLVGLNEYEKAGAVIHLMNGAMARRHEDAIVIITDNVGYSSCRPIDPSVLRRQAMIIDSYELSEQLLKDRVRRNTGCTDSALIDRCFNAWQLVKEHCEQNSITEGSVSPMEFERFVQAQMLDGEFAFEQNLQDCIISKATSSIDDQRDILSALSVVL